MTDIRQLISQLHEIAWSAVPGPAADPWAGGGGTQEERRAGSLGLLAIYSQLVKVLQRRIDLTIKDALDSGSDYGEIAAACGVSRQAIRQRWLRRTAGSRRFEVRLPSLRPRSRMGGRPRDYEPARVVWVRLVGGPYDGGGDETLRGKALRYKAVTPSSGSPDSVPLMACYVPSQDDANVYVFAGVERYHRRPAGAGGPKPRVYELAAEFEVDSKVVMAKLEEMGEFVRSASSTVERPLARKLQEQFTVRSKPRTSGYVC